MATSRLCSIPGCDKPHRAKGMCNSHYERVRLHNYPRTKSPTLIAMAPRKRGKAQSFYQDVVREYEGDECLIWPFNRTPKGYAVMMVNKKPVFVSRVICIEVNGPPPTEKHHAAHVCGKGRFGCVTKKHMAWKTPVENEADKRVHGTIPRTRPKKLSDDQIKEVIALRGKETQESIARRFGVVRQTISVIHRKCTLGEAPLESEAVDV